MRAIFVAVVLAATSTLGWASVTPCTAATTGDTLSVINGEGGCSSVDLVYSGYSTSTASGNPGLTNIYVSGLNAPAYGTDTLSPLQVDYNSGHGEQFNAPAGQSTSTSFNYHVAIDTNTSDIPTYQDPNTAGDIWAFNTFGAGGLT